MRPRFGWFSRSARVLLTMVVVLAGGLSAAALTVASGALPDVGELQRIAASLATALVVFLVLIPAATVLVTRPILLRASSMSAAMGVFVVALVLSLGARLLGPLVEKSGPVYGSFATVAGIFALLYLVSQVLLFAAEVAVVRHRRLWPRALDPLRPTPADRLSLTRLANAQERLAIERIEVRFDRPVPDGSETDS